MSHECAGYVKDDFWQRRVHQLGEEEPAVQHASIAMSPIDLRANWGWGRRSFGCALAFSI
ncbi:unnamed protein product [Penicillium camemberti]|uniref:Str. FM013 n=1 Tax=Penicillium camemberti (strain FM 013) TaxID=1429867 RepID=A0A0G4P210_PENC3|nr:unnamed protein product [Penicillium camemberti]